MGQRHPAMRVMEKPVGSIVLARDRAILDSSEICGVHAAALVLQSTMSYLEVDIAASLVQQIWALLEAQC